MISFSTVKNTILETKIKRKIRDLRKNKISLKILTIYITFKIQIHSPSSNPDNIHNKLSTIKIKILSCKKTELIQVSNSYLMSDKIAFHSLIKINNLTQRQVIRQRIIIILKAIMTVEVES